MNWRINVGLSVLLLIYICVGALVFYVLEYEKFTPADISTMQFYKDFLASHHPNVAPSELEAFTRRVVQLTEEADGQVVVAENATEQDNGWTYDNAVYFTITVVSTIGYGHITPKTTGGKWFCIVFALVGIPMAMALLASVGVKLKGITDRLHKARPLCRNNATRDRRLKSAFLLALSPALMLCIPALVFKYTEDWDYLTALYYTTITLTTVGFGDYVAGDGKRSNWFRLLLCGWLVVGLAYLALVISEVSELYAGWHSKVKEDNPEDKPQEPSEPDDRTPEPNGTLTGDSHK